MAQASVIIHTRTRLCDFPSTFAVCPSAFGGGDIEKVRKQILAVTRSIDSMGQNEVRQMIYTCGDFVIAGMVSFLKNFSGNNTEDEKFFFDEKGRSIYAFVGFVFQAKNQSAPLIDRKILWESFKAYMEPVWERTVLDTRSSDFKEIDFAPAISKEPANGETVYGMTLYTMGTEDTFVFSYWLGQALKGKSVSFCSNVTDFKVVKDKPFNIITTTANIVERMKRENKSVPPAHSQPAYSSLGNNSTANQKKTSTEEKPLKTVWIVIGGILFIILLMVLLLK